MPMLTVGQAARLTGLNKTTMNRAIQRGRLSAHRHDDGSWRLDPAELQRVYAIRYLPESLGAPQDEAPNDASGRAPQGTQGQPQGAPDAMHWVGEAHRGSEARIAALEGEAKGLQAEVQALK